MADAIKSVVVEIETKLQGNAIDNLNKGLRTADSLSEELARQIQVVDKAIQSTNAKRLKINGTDTSKKELQELSNALKLAAQDFDQLSDIQKNTLAALLKENAKVVESLENTAHASDGAKQGAEGYLRAINVLTPLLGQHGVAISLVVSNYLEYAEAARRGESASTQLGSVLNVLRNGYAALAIAATAFIATGINEYISNTGAGSDKASEALSGVKQVISELSQTALAALISGFGRFIGNQKLATQGTNDFYDALQRLPKAFERGVEIEQTFDQIEDATFRLRLEVSELSLELAKSREILAEQAFTIDDITKKEIEAARLRINSEKIATREKELAEQRLNAEIKRVDFSTKFTEAQIRQGIAQKDLSFLTKEYVDSIAAAIEEIDRIALAEAQRGKQNERIIKGIRAERKALVDGFTTSLVEVNNKINDTAESFITLLTSGNIKPEDKAKIQKELIKQFTGIFKEFEKVFKQGETLSPGIFDGTKDQLIKAAEAIGVDPTFIQRIKDAFKDTGDLFNKAFVESFIQSGPERANEEFKKKFKENFAALLGEVKAIVKSEGSFDDEVFGGDAPEKEKFDIYKKIFGDDAEAGREAVESFKSNIREAFNTFIDSEIAKTDFLIQEQQRRIDETNRLAALGNAEQLQLEQERLNKLLEERRKFEQAQQAINAAAAISATAASAANFTLALTKDAATLTPVLAIANSIALVAAIAAGIAQISSLAQGFEKGTEYLTPGQKSNKGKTDTIPAWLAPGERVVPAMINEQLKGIKNADLPKLVAAGKMALEGYGQLNTSITSNSYGFTSEAVGLLKRQNELLAEIPKAVSDQIVDINFDHYGYVIQQRRVSRHAQKVKALTR